MTRSALFAAALTAVATVSTVAHAKDDRALCSTKGLDLKCLLAGPGFTVVPRLGPESAYFVTFAKPSGAPYEAVYGRGGWLQAWTTPTDLPFREVAWAGGAHTFQIHGAPGATAIGGVDGGAQSSYMDLSRGDGVAFVANLDHVTVGPRTTLEVHFAKAPQTRVDVVDAGKFGSTLRLVVDVPFVARRTAGGRTCLFWDPLDAVCLEGWPDEPVPVVVDGSGDVARVIRAGRTADGARLLTPNLPAVMDRQSKLGEVPF